jgi:diaminopimelate decarboxylase
MPMLSEIAEIYGTPCYVYSRQMLEKNFKSFQENFKEISYAVKANSNLAILEILAKLGSGFDIVSLGELTRGLKAKVDPQKIVFSGVGKQEFEIQKSLEVGIGCFNIESKFECDQINIIAKSLNKIAPIALRINPDISVKTHPYIATGLKENKFGIAYEDAASLYHYANQLSHLKIKGIACHLGSQIMEEEPYLLALKKLLNLIEELSQNNIIISHIDLGGGFGIDYKTQKKLDIASLSQKINKLLENKMTLSIEPGRALVAECGILLTRVISLKCQSEKNFAIVDAAMNDLLRPALYKAWHDVIPLIQREENFLNYDIVGPVCETGDFLAKNRKLSLQPNDLLQITMAGAYGSAMSSNYNSRPRCAEVLIDGNKHYLIRERETYEDLMAKEKCLL